MDVPRRYRPALAVLAGVLAAVLGTAAWWFWIRDDGRPVLYAEGNGWSVYDRVGTPLSALAAYDDGCFVGFGGPTVWSAEDDCVTVHPLWTVEERYAGDSIEFTDGIRLPDGRYAGLLQASTGDSRAPEHSYVLVGTPGGDWRMTLLPSREPDAADPTRDGRILWDGANLIVITNEGAEATTWTSPDGLTWTPHPAPAAAPDGGTGVSVESYRLATDGKGLVVAAVAYRDAAAPGPKQAMWRSTDSGATWTATTAVPEPESVTVTELLYDGTRFTAFGERHPAGGSAPVAVAFVATTVDGMTWTPDGGLAGCGTVSGAVAAGGGVMAFTDGGTCRALVYEQVGGAWEQRPNPPEGTPEVALALPDGRIVGAQPGFDRVWVREAG